MTTKYFAILTNQGAARLANATMLGTKLNITQMAVGDGNGTLPTPDPAQTKLINQTRIAPINSLSVDAHDAGQIIAEQIIPENEGGFFIREIGLYDDDGILIAVANCPETYKPLLAEGSGRTQTIRMILVVSSTSAITLKIDPSVVLATRKYVDDAVIEVKSYVDGIMRNHEQSRNHPDATTTAKGFTQLNSSVTDDRETQSATPKAVKIAMDNANARLAKERNLADLPNPALARQNLQLGNSSTKNTGTTADTVAAGDDSRITGAMQKSQNGADIPDVAKFLQNLRIGEIYAPINSPSFTGTPSVPTADQSEIDFRIANTAFVAQAIAILNGGAPAALNTLKKLALAINNDASFYSTVNNALGQKAALSDFTYSKTSSSVVGNQPGGLRFICGETSVPTDSNGNVFITLPDTFLNRVVYAEAHQSKGSYTADVDPFIFSSYPASNGPTSTISFAVRNSKTGVPLINSAITLQYFVKGY